MTLLRQLNSNGTWIKFLLIFIFLWGFLVYIFATRLTSTSNSNLTNSNANDLDSGQTIKRINQAMELLEESRQRNDDLRLLIDSFLSEHVDQEKSAQKFIDSLEKHLKKASYQQYENLNAPSLEYEQLRRRIRQNTQEMWNYFSGELTKIRKKVIKDVPEISDDIRHILELGIEHKRSLLSDMDTLQTVDGYEKWRQQEAEDLSDLIQSRLTHLQNPKDCSKARKLVCKLNKGCGYGCQLHHIVYCFIVAYATERTLILKSKGWRYHKAGWDEVFHSVSDTCTDVDASHATSWPGKHDSMVVVLPIIDSLMPRPAYLPLAIPEDLAPRLTRLHGDPIVWWVGQFLKYLLKPRHQTQEMIESGMEKLGFKKPIVGIHVRRTDKVGTEAAFHGIEEYMSYVEDYYLTLEINGTHKMDRRVYLASDDPRVIDEAKKKYKQYEIIGDPDVARMAAVSTRYSDSSLNGIILDIHMLSLCDYLVCTFSSQVCRVAYEIMNTFYPDASHRFKSLDDIYYYGGQNSHNKIAIIPHKSKNKDEIQMRIGDSVGVAGNHWDGYSKGKNTRTNQVGLFPSFKVIDKVETVSLPLYSNVQKRRRK